MTQQAPRSGVAHVNDTQLYYEVAGTGHPFTLIHGLLLDRRSWKEAVINAFFAARSIEGCDGRRVDALPVDEAITILQPWKRGI